MTTDHETTIAAIKTIVAELEVEIAAKAPRLARKAERSLRKQDRRDRRARARAHRKTKLQDRAHATLEEKSVNHAKQIERRNDRTSQKSREFAIRVFRRYGVSDHVTIVRAEPYYWLASPGNTVIEGTIVGVPFTMKVGRGNWGRTLDRLWVGPSEIVVGNAIELRGAFNFAETQRA